MNAFFLVIVFSCDIMQTTYIFNPLKIQKQKPQLFNSAFMKSIAWHFGLNLFENILCRSFENILCRSFENFLSILTFHFDRKHAA